MHQGDGDGASESAERGSPEAVGIGENVYLHDDRARQQLRSLCGDHRGIGHMRTDPARVTRETVDRESSRTCRPIRLEWSCSRIRM